jgi:hypothetical protein
MVSLRASSACLGSTHPTFAARFGGFGLFAMSTDCRTCQLFVPFGTFLLRA